MARRELAREPIWTESIAVGSELFVNGIGKEVRNRRELSYESLPGDRWVVKDATARYSPF